MLKIISALLLVLSLNTYAQSLNYNVCKVDSASNSDLEQVVLRTGSNRNYPNTLELKYKSGYTERLKAVQTTDAFGTIVTSSRLSDKNAIGKRLNGQFLRATGEKVFVRYNVHVSPKYADGCYMGSRCYFMRIKLAFEKGEKFDFVGDNICDRSSEGLLPDVHQDKDSYKVIMDLNNFQGLDEYYFEGFRRNHLKELEVEIVGEKRVGKIVTLIIEASPTQLAIFRSQSDASRIKIEKITN